MKRKRFKLSTTLRYFALLPLIVLGVLSILASVGPVGFPTFTVGGTVSGLAGSGLVLHSNAGDNLAITANGAFTFPTPYLDDIDYNVTVLTQPTNPSQTCTVTNGSGTINGADVTNVSVSCITLALLFSADDGVNGRELWRSDGTAAGTVLVKDINPAGDSFPAWLTMFNGTLYFAADDGVDGRELWRSDGTDAGTFLVKDINPGAGGSSPQELTVSNGALYFTATDGVNGRGLWKSDGTDAGTVLAKDITPSSTSFPAGPIVFNGALYFVADDGVTGSELWRSDGTDAGTVLVKDINPGAGDSSPQELTAF